MHDPCFKGRVCGFRLPTRAFLDRSLCRVTAVSRRTVPPAWAWCANRVYCHSWHSPHREYLTFSTRVSCNPLLSILFQHTSASSDDYHLRKCARRHAGMGGGRGHGLETGEAAGHIIKRSWISVSASESMCVHAEDIRDGRNLLHTSVAGLCRRARTAVRSRTAVCSRTSPISSNVLHPASLVQYNPIHGPSRR